MDLTERDKLRLDCEMVQTIIDEVWTTEELGRRLDELVEQRLQEIVDEEWPL